MNTKEFLKIKEDARFNEKKHVFFVETSKVKQEFGSNARVGDTATRKLPALITDIRNRGQQVPVSVVRHPSKDEYILKDGTTRWHACKSLGIDVLVSVYHAEVPFKNQASECGDWFFFQCESNANHEVSTLSSDADIRKQVNDIVQKQFLNPVVGRPFTVCSSRAEKEEWVKSAVENKLSKVFPIDQSKIKKILWDRLSAHMPNDELKNYTKIEELEFFNSYNPFVKRGTSVTKIGGKYEADNGEMHAFYRAATPSHIEKEILSYSYRGKMKDPKIKVVVQVQHQDIVRSDSAGIGEEIGKLVRAAKRLNDAGGFFFGKRQVKVIDYIVVLPQLKENKTLKHKVITL
jgi:hypothetical protein